jgi:hypothetical protein
MELAYEIGPLAVIPIVAGGLVLWSKYKNRRAAVEDAEVTGAENGEGNQDHDAGGGTTSEQMAGGLSTGPIYGVPMDGRVEEAGGLVYTGIEGGGGTSMYPPPPQGIYGSASNCSPLGLYPPPPPPSQQQQLPSSSGNPPAIPDSCWLPPSA